MYICPQCKSSFSSKFCFERHNRHYSKIWILRGQKLHEDNASTSHHSSSVIEMSVLSSQRSSFFASRNEDALDNFDFSSLSSALEKSSSDNNSFSHNSLSNSSESFLEKDHYSLDRRSGLSNYYDFDNASLLYDYISVMNSSDDSCSSSRSDCDSVISDMECSFLIALMKRVNLMKTQHISILLRLD